MKERIDKYLRKRNSVLEDSSQANRMTQAMIDTLRENGWCDAEIQAAIREVWDAGYDSGSAGKEPS